MGPSGAWRVAWQSLWDRGLHSSAVLVDECFPKGPHVGSWASSSGVLGGGSQDPEILLLTRSLATLLAPPLRRAPPTVIPPLRGSTGVMLTPAPRASLSRTGRGINPSPCQGPEPPIKSRTMYWAQSRGMRPHVPHLSCKKYFHIKEFSAETCLGDFVIRSSLLVVHEERSESSTCLASINSLISRSYSSSELVTLDDWGKLSR